MSFLPLIVQDAMVGYLAGQVFPLNEEPFAFIITTLLNAILTVTYGVMKASE